MNYYRQGFLHKCHTLGVSQSMAHSLLKVAESKDPNLSRATEIFQEWLTTKKHTVRRGEVLSGIASKYKVPLETLLEANNLPSVTAIKPGQQIKIPIEQGNKNARKV